MKRLYIFAIYFFVPIITCFGQNIDSVRGTKWVNIGYLQDMENYLPCECADSINYWYSVSIAPKIIQDSENEAVMKYPEVIANRVVQIEPSQFYIISETTTKYVISEDEKKFYDLILKNDTLLLLDSVGCHKFVKLSNTNNYSNIALLNTTLLSRGYQTIESILENDSLSLACAQSWGNINLIYSHKREDLCWVLEIFDGFLHIYKVKNPLRDPLDPVLKKEIKKLKWVKNGKERQPRREEYPIWQSPK